MKPNGLLKKGRDGDRIVGGLGVIENDFHERKDLTPNICAVYDDFLIESLAPMTHDEAFAKLARSKFRSRFHLSPADRRYIAEKGMETIRSHAADFVRDRLAPANPPNDGRQTPMRGHPVFIAQHATATCCRGCLEKWWKFPRGIPIPPERQAGIVDFLMAWIGRENAT